MADAACREIGLPLSRLIPFDREALSIPMFGTRIEWQVPGEVQKEVTWDVLGSR